MFIATLAGGLLAAPLAAEAQPAGKLPRIGFLFSGAPGPRESRRFPARPARPRLHRGSEHRHRVAVRRRAGERLPELAAELVRLKADVIVAADTPAALAAKRATTHDSHRYRGRRRSSRRRAHRQLRATRVGTSRDRRAAVPRLGGKRLELLKEAGPQGLSRGGPLQSGRSANVLA